MNINKEYRDLVKKINYLSNRTDRLFALYKSGARGVKLELLTTLRMRNVAAKKANQIRENAKKNKKFTYWGF